MQKQLILISLLLCFLIMGANVPDVGFRDNYLTVGTSSQIGQRVTSAGGQWDGHEFVVTLVLDDGYAPQIDLRACFDSLGVKCTLGLGQVMVGKSAGLSKTAVDTFYLNGHEVASTGRYSISPGGLVAAADTSVVRFIAEPSWIDSTWGNTAAGGPVPGYVFPRTYITDVGPLSYEIVSIIHDLGYTSQRGVYIGTNAQYTSGPGSPRWDREYRWPDPETVFPLYGYGVVRTESNPGDNYGIFYADAWTPPGVVQARADSIFTLAAEHNNAPIVLVFHRGETYPGPGWRDNDFPFFYEYVNSQYDVKWATAGELGDMLRENLEFRDAPAWAPYAQLEGVTAADEIFIGPAEPTYAAAADSYLVSNSTTAVDSTLYPHRITYGHRYASVSALTPNTPITSSDLMYADLGIPPVSGGEELGLFYFNLTPLVGKDIVSVSMHWCNSGTVVDQTGLDIQFFGSIGLEVAPYVVALRDSTGVDYTMLNGLSTLNDYTWPTMFGDFMRPINYAAASVFYDGDFTEFVRDRLALGDTGVGFAMYGYHSSDALDPWRIWTHDYGAGAGQPYRPYLIIKTAD